jgi:hypothetical protein
MKLSRDALPVIILFVILAVVTGYGASRQAEAGREYPPGSIESAQPDGARALYLWLHELGYRTTVIEGQSFAIGQDVDVLLALGPLGELDRGFGVSDVDVVERWVSDGGTLVIAQGNGWDALLCRFDLETEWDVARLDQAGLAQPILTSSPFVTATVRTNFHVKRDLPDNAVVHMAAEGQPVVVSRQLLKSGSGRVIVISGLYPFTNAGLRDPSNATLVYNLILVGAGRDGLVAFDEYHHGQRDPVSLRTWLVSTPPGWAILYGLLVVFAYLLIGGQRFGAAVPLPEHMARRTTGEFITAMANLRRRAGRRHDALRHYKEQLKRRLARPYRIDPKLADDQFVDELARCDPIHDARRSELVQVLTRLDRKRLTEREMIDLAGQAAAFPGDH